MSNTNATCTDCGVPCMWRGASKFGVPLCGDCYQRRRREGTAVQLPTRPVSHAAKSDNAAHTYYQALLSVAEKSPEPVAPPIDSDACTLVCLLSDLHVGKTTDEGYDSEVAAQRMDTLASRIINLATNHIQSSVDIDEIVFAVLGDILDGEGIYEHQAHNSDLPAFDQLRIAGEMVWRLIRRVADAIPTAESVRVECVPGNHGTIKVRGSAPINNWDNVLYYSLGLMANADDRISVGYSPHGWRNVDVKGHVMHLRHIGPKGASTAAQQRELLARRVKHGAETLLFGHLHHAHYEDYFGPTYWNGCVCGPDELSEQIGVNAEPTQWIFGVDREKPETFQYKVYMK